MEDLRAYFSKPEYFAILNLHIKLADGTIGQIEHEYQMALSLYQCIDLTPRERAAAELLAFISNHRAIAWQRESEPPNGNEPAPPLVKIEADALANQTLDAVNRYAAFLPEPERAVLLADCEAAPEVALDGITRVTWIDNEGRVRLDHDENFQMVSPFEVDSIWHLTDSWGIDLACRLILLGYNEDIKRSISYGFEHCPEGSTGRDRAHALITIADRFMTLAKSTIALGNTLKNSDTPANWVAWAKCKGYSVAHLMPTETKVKAVLKEKSLTTQGGGWKEQSRVIADECFDRDTSNGCRDSLDSYCNRVMEKMQERDIKGPRGIIDNLNTIKRDALQGDKWWRKKQK